MNNAELDALFQRAIIAFDADDLPALQRLLGDHPEMATARLASPGGWLRDKIGGALDGFFKKPYLLWLFTEDAPRLGRLPSRIGAMTRAVLDTARRDAPRKSQDLLETTFHFALCAPIGRGDGGNLDLLDALLDAGPELKGAAFQAMICGNAPAAEHVLRRGAPLDLMTAVVLGRWDDVARLGPNAPAKDKQMALALAALNGKPEGLRRLLPFGVEISDYSTGFYTHATPLHHAVWSGSLEAVKVLVEAGADLTPRDKAYGATPLGWAIYAQEGDSGQPTREYAAIEAFLRERGAPP